MALDRSVVAETIGDKLADQTSGESFSLVETETEKGPGYINPYTLLVRNERDIFAHTSVTPVVSSKRKIIISSPLLCDRPLNYIEIIYFASLIEYYDVYFWRGPSIPFMTDRCPLLYSLSDFVIQKKEIFSATKKDVITVLGNQGVAIDTVIILDHDALSEAMGRLARSRYYRYAIFPHYKPSHLDLGWYSDIENLHTIIRGIDRNKIKFITVQVMTPRDAQEIITLFPYLETICVLSPTHAWIQECLPVFSNTNITVSLNWKNRNPSTITLPENVNMNTLIIRGRESNFITFISSNAQVKHLKFIDITGFTLHVSPQLQHLEIKNCWNVRLIIPKENQLEKLYVDGSNFSQHLDVRLFPRLTNFRYINSAPSNITFLTDKDDNCLESISCIDIKKRNYMLREIELRGETEEKYPMDLSRYAELKEVKSNNHYQLTLPDDYKQELSINTPEEKEFFPVISPLATQPYNFNYNQERFRGARYANLAALIARIDNDEGAEDVDEEAIESIVADGLEWNTITYGQIVTWNMGTKFKKLKYFYLVISQAESVTIDFTNCRELQSINIQIRSTSEIKLTLTGCDQLRTLTVINQKRDGRLIIEGIDQCPKLRYPLHGPLFRPPVQQIEPAEEIFFSIAEFTPGFIREFNRFASNEFNRIRGSLIHVTLFMLVATGSMLTVMLLLHYILSILAIYSTILILKKILSLIFIVAAFFAMVALTYFIYPFLSYFWNRYITEVWNAIALDPAYMRDHLIPALSNFVLIIAGTVALYCLNHFTALGSDIYNYLITTAHSMMSSAATASSHMATIATTTATTAAKTVGTKIASLWIFAHPVALLVIGGSLVLCALAYLLWARRRTIPPIVETPNLNKKFYLDSDVKLTRSNKNPPLTDCQFALHSLEENKSGLRTRVYNRFWTHDSNNKVTLETRHGYGIQEELKVETSTIVDQNPLERSTRPDEHLLQCTGKFKPEELHELASDSHAVLSANDLLGIYTNVPADSLHFYYDPDLQHLYFRYQGDPSQEITFFYKLRKQPVFDGIFDVSKETDVKHILKRPPKDFFPEDFIQVFKEKLLNDGRLQDNRLRENPNLMHLKIFLDENETLERRMKSLHQFFMNFREGRTLDPKPSPDNDMETMLEIILQYSGASRHRNYAFVFLCQLCGFDCYFIDSGIDNGADQNYSVLRYQLPDGSIYDKTVSFSPVSPAPSQEDMQVSSPRSTPNASTSKKTVRKTGDQIILEEMAAYKRYYKILKETVSRQELRSLDQIISFSESDTEVKGNTAKNRKNFSPLLILNEAQDPFAVNAAIVRHLKRKNINTLKNHLFINDVKDFAYYLSPGKIENGKQTNEQEGPLRRLLTNQDEDGVLVVDFSELSDAKKIAYQTLFDNPPTITIPVREEKNGIVTIHEETFHLPKRLKVVGFMKENDPAGESLASRATHWTVHEEFFTSSVELEEKKSETVTLSDADEGAEHSDTNKGKVNDAKPVEVELFKNSTAFEELLLGPVFLDGSKIESEPGPLLDAITADRPVTIYNPPNTKKYRRLVHAVNGERKFFLPLDAKMVDLDSTSQVFIEEKTQEIPKELPGNVKIICEDEKTTTMHRKRIHLTVSNLHEYYKIVSINEKTLQANTDRNGLLGQYQPDQDIFYITGFIPLSYWQRLMHEIAQDKNRNKPFKFLLAPGASIEGIEKNNYSVEPDEKASTYLSNDPDYLTQQLLTKNENMRKHTWVIDINEKTTFNDLVGEITQKSKGFSVKKGVVLHALESRYSVILNGKMSYTLYQQLLPLLSKENPHIDFNGKRIVIGKNKFIVVMPDNNMNPLCYQKRDFSFEDYRKELLKKYSADHLNQIEHFYKIAGQLPHRGPGRPSKPYISFHRIETMLKALKHPSNDKHNPVKCIFNADYPEDSADYAYLNVMGKMIFNAEDKKRVKLTKLIDLMARFSIQEPRDVKAHAWHLLNCFQGAMIKEIIGENIKQTNGNEFPALLDESLKKLSEEVFKIKQQYLEEKRNPLVEAKENGLEEKLNPRARHEKQMAQLTFYLEQKDHPIIILQGPAGVGKSHAVRKLLGKGKYYEGEKDIIKWLESDGSTPFLADEMNMTDCWDFLEGLGRPDKTVVYKGKRYPLTKHQVIGTCNPVGPQYPNRFFVKVIQNLAVTIHFKTPTENFYRDVIQDKLNTVSLLHAENHSLIINNLINAFYLIQKYNPHVMRSIRDIEDITERFIQFYNKEQKMNESALKELLFKTCMRGFAPSIRTASERQRFANDLRDKLGLTLLPSDEKKSSEMIQLTDKISIPESARYFVEAIEEQLEMRWQMLLKNAIAKHHKLVEEKKQASDAETASTTPPLPYYKQSSIVEGEPGVGKSTYLRAIVEKHINALKIRKKELENKKEVLLCLSWLALWTVEEQIELDLLEKEIKKPVYEISGGSADPRGQLTEALHKECILIEDESNINPEADALLSQFLCGQDENGKPISYPGFLHFGSQNSTLHKGRNVTSTSKGSRCNLIYLDTFPDAGLKAFAQQKVDFPEQYLLAYKKVCTECDYANVRTLHHGLDRAAEEEAVLAAKDHTQLGSILSDAVSSTFYSPPPQPPRPSSFLPTTTSSALTLA